MLKFKKGSYKILGHFNPDDRQAIIIKQVDGYLFEYNGRQFGTTKQYYNTVGELNIFEDYLVTDIKSGLSVNIYARSRDDIESIFEKRKDIIFAQFEKDKIKQAEDIIRNSYLGGLFNILKNN